MDQPSDLPCSHLEVASWENSLVCVWGNLRCSSVLVLPHRFQWRTGIYVRHALSHLSRQVLSTTCHLHWQLYRLWLCGQMGKEPVLSAHSRILSHFHILSQLLASPSTKRIEWLYPSLREEQLSSAINWDLLGGHHSGGEPILRQEHESNDDLRLNSW